MSSLPLPTGGAEISAFHAASKLIFTIGGNTSLSAINFNDPVNPILKETITLSGNTNSVAVSSTGLVAVAVEGTGSARYTEGKVFFYTVSGVGSNATITAAGSVDVGIVPDSIAFTPDGNKLVVANEGEPNELYTVDPEGTVSVISINNTTPADSTVETLGFTALNGREAELKALGIRISGIAGTTAAKDLEPEYVAISPDGKKAYVTFQENNAIGVINIEGNTPVLESLRAVGVQDYVRGKPSVTNYDLVIASPGTTSAGAVVPGGGLSGLYATGRDAQGRLLFIAPADRGPNGGVASKDVVKADGTPGTDGTADAVQPFLLPDYQARFYKLALDEKTGVVSTLGEIKLTQKDGTTPITGRSNGKGDQIPVDANGNLLSYDPYGADLESIVQDKDGNIWMSDEYRPAVYKFNATGQLIERYVPVGAGVAAGLAAGALGKETLPAEYAKRQTNRGFEGMAYDEANGKLFAFVQSPLDDVGANDGKKSSLIRILEIDATTGNPSAEYLYSMAGKDTVSPDGSLYEAKVDKIGDVAYDAKRQVFYVLERDSAPGALSYKQVFEVSLKGATNILGNAVANEENLSIDSLLSTHSIKLASKVLITNLASIGYIPNDKPEGLALLSDGRLAVINDNDFGVTSLTATEYTALSTTEKAKYSLASDINGSKTYVYSNPAVDAKIQLGIVNFTPTYIDPNDRDGGIKLLANQNIYGLRMPDGIAAYQAVGANGSAQTFTIIANEGDGRVRPDGDYTDPSTDVKTKEGAKYNDEFRQGVTGTGTDTRLKTIKDLGNYDSITTAYEQKFSFGGRSITILDSLGNIVWDSGDLIDRAAIAAGIYDDTRSDDKGSEPENLTVATIAGRNYAFVGLERGTSSSIATFDITNPYNAYLVDFHKSSNTIISPEGLLFIPAATSPNGKDLLISSNEISKDLEVLNVNQGYSLQILHYYGESGTLGITTAPIMGALIDKFDDKYANTLVIGEGDSFIPGPWLVAGADPSLNNSTAIKTTALGRPDIAIMNLFGTNVSALGNHEFDLGSPVLSSAFAASGTWGGALFPFITSNLNFANDSSLRGLADASLGGASTNTFAGREASEIKAKIAPYTVVTKGGEKIGIVGATTWDLLSKSSPNGTIVKDDANAATSDLQEVAAYVQASVNALIALGVNKVVMVDQLDGLIDRNKALAPLLSGVDVMVAGGGHERLGDPNDVPVAFNGHDANFISTDNYPIVVNDKDGKPTVIVTTDTEYSYLGRLVVNFDANGNVITSALDDKLNGAYAASAAALKAAYGTGQSVDEIIASSSIGKAVADITSRIDTVISSKDGTIYGYTNVYLEGDRTFGRAQQVNIGDLTADANLFAASKAVTAVVPLGSLKNGGGIRASIGSVDGNGIKTKPTATNVKPAGGISQLEIENALRFDNKLMVFDTTPQGLLAILNYLAGLSAGNGGYAQVGGIRFSFDPSKPSGSKVQDIAIVDLAGNIVSKVADNGIITSDAPKTISMVTLNFLANGGDSYPIKANASNFRYILSDGKLSAAIDSSKDFTAADVVPANALGEQAALQGYLKSFHGTPEKAYGQIDTQQNADQRIQNLSVRAIDTVFSDMNNPLLRSKTPGLKITEVFTIGESVDILNDSTPSYIPTGTPDGMGAYLKDANTIRLLFQSEITKDKGYEYKLANNTALTGARIHYLDIDKASNQVIGAGLAYDKVYDRTGALVTTASQISGDANTKNGFDRFCAANLIEANPFGTGKGFADRIELLGEESGSANNSLGGAMYALDVANNALHALPDLGFGSWEGATAV
ncbi:esterase-like activity of phytase family protein, partial [Synechococcus sp. UW140]|uniref:choice-of-anchor I domain-containing protein n=1 Tax=Synechococcus sp. UW140 TaxID=368503 RepID=UPI003138067D